MTITAARAFDKAGHDPETLAKFWDKAPVQAAQWLLKVAEAAGATTDGLVQLQQALAAKNAAVQVVATREQFPTLTDVFTSTGWDSAQPPPEPPVFTGTLQLLAGVPKLVCTTGTYELDLSLTSWREEVETAFLDQVISVKGFPSADGSRLYLEQFAPGADPHFVSGRIEVNGTDVFLSPVTQTGQVALSRRMRVTDPAFAALLSGNAGLGLTAYNPAGVILPGGGVVDPQTGERTYPHHPTEGFYILGRVMTVGQGAVEGRVLHHLETGFFQPTDAVSPESVTVPTRSQPGNGHFDPADVTIGSTKATDGRRMFAFVRILPPETQVPGISLTRARRVEMTWVSDACDQGKRSVPSSGRPARDLPTVAKYLPAALPKLTNADRTLKPDDAPPFSVPLPS